MKDNFGLEARRKGRVLEIKINVLLDTPIALKTLRAVYEVEKSLYESRIRKSNTLPSSPKGW